MKLTEVHDAASWEAFQTHHPWAQFTQSWMWGEFRQSQGCEVRRFVLTQVTSNKLQATSEEVLCAVQMEYRTKPLVGGYWFAARGPIFSPHVPEKDFADIFYALVRELEEIGLARALFWRFEPLVQVSSNKFQATSYGRQVAALNPASTILLDLTLSEEELLAAMHHKTRYNIRLAERHGVTTRVSTEAEDLEKFIALLQETMQRDEFLQHPNYLRATFEFLRDHHLTRIRLAEHDGKLLAANMEIMYGDTTTYLHGASSSSSRELMAPYALQWDAIRQAKQEKHAHYDFWGVNSESKDDVSYKPSWEGITRFKRGWGGRQVDLVGTWDMPQSWLYQLLKVRKLF